MFNLPEQRLKRRMPVMKTELHAGFTSNMTCTDNVGGVFLRIDLIPILFSHYIPMWCDEIFQLWLNNIVFGSNSQQSP